MSMGLYIYMITYCRHEVMHFSVYSWLLLLCISSIVCLGTDISEGKLIILRRKHTSLFSDTSAFHYAGEENMHVARCSWCRNLTNFLIGLYKKATDAINL